MSNYYGDVTLSSEDLEHYGILGMKWGVRRYQNSDGTYTAEGLKRRGGGSGKNEGSSKESSSGKSGKRSSDAGKASKKVTYSDDYKNAHRKKDPRSMTNEELRKTNERLNLERNYKQNTTPQQKQINYQYSEGQKFVQQTMKSMGSAAIAAGVTAHVIAGSREGGNKAAKFWNESASTGEKFIIGAALAGVTVGALYYAYHQNNKSDTSNRSSDDDYYEEDEDDE